MSAWIIAAIAVYVLGATCIVAAWRWSLNEGEPGEWCMCAVVALLWPLLAVVGALG